MADARRTSREAHQRASHPYVLRGRLYCGVLRTPDARPVQQPRSLLPVPLPRDYALASHVRHPGNIYLREADLLPAIDAWLVVIFAPHRLEQTSARCKRPRTRARTPPRPPGPAKTLRPSSLTVTPGLPLPGYP
jgi:site-specific DNA recombinase